MFGIQGRMTAGELPNSEYNLKNCGVRIVHEAPTDGSAPNNARRSNLKPPYMINELAIKIRHTWTSRSLGVFALHPFVRGHKIIIEHPIFTCIPPAQKDLASWCNTVAERWCSLSMMHQERFKSQFDKMQHMPTSAQQLTVRQSEDFFNFIKEYSFCNPPKTRVHIYHYASHMNHACSNCANAEFWIQPGLPHTLTVRLLRDVRKGQEIYFSYNRISGNQFGCAICGLRDGTTSRFAKFWHGMIRWFAGVRPVGPNSEQEPTPQPSQAIGARATTDVEMQTNVEAPVDVGATADVDITTDADAPASVDPVNAGARADIETLVDVDTTTDAEAPINVDAEAQTGAEATADGEASTGAQAPIHANSSDVQISLRRRVLAWAGKVVGKMR